MSTSTTDMSPEQRVNTVFELLQISSKKEHIDGEMTQLDHALQAAQLAKNDGADEETILAALLLDIGSLIPLTEQRSDTPGKEGIGYKLTDMARTVGFHVSSAFRNLGFSNKTSELIESNVMAKRYILTVDPLYIDNSKPVTVSYAVLRGGQLSPTEMAEFQKDPLFKQKVQLAKWDAAATKTADITPPALDTYRDMAIRNILMSMRTLY
ncbi:hypothetical protein H4R27_004428 [Coemansia aciculifera]|nr:hypothetical protein H4R27_004428 [Coemansia aciculifera]